MRVIVVQKFQCNWCWNNLNEDTSNNKLHVCAIETPQQLSSALSITKKNHEDSVGRHKKWKEALKAVCHQGNKMKKVSIVRGRTKVGHIAQIILVDVEISKGDNKTLAKIKIRSKEPHSCKLAHRSFQMKNYWKEVVSLLTM